MKNFHQHTTTTKIKPMKKTLHPSFRMTLPLQVRTRKSSLLFAVCLLPYLSAFAVELPTPVIEVLNDTSETFYNTGSAGDELKQVKSKEVTPIAVEQIPYAQGKSVSRAVVTAESAYKAVYEGKLPAHLLPIGAENWGLTIAFWVNPGAVVRNMNFVSLFPGFLKIQTLPNENQVGNLDAEIKVNSQSNPDKKNAGYHAVSPADVLVPNEWHFYTLVAEPGEGLRFFRDGVEIGQSKNGIPADPVTGVTSESSLQFILGGGYGKKEDATGQPPKFSTALVFDKPLAADQVAELFKRQTSQP
jgi:hypothetical protein